jgi:hypothetical protein
LVSEEIVEMTEELDRVIRANADRAQAELHRVISESEVQLKGAPADNKDAT